VRDAVLFLATKAEHGIARGSARDYIRVFTLGRVDADLVEEGFEELTRAVGKGATSFSVCGGEELSYD